MNMNKYTFWRLIALGCAIFISICFALSTLLLQEPEKTYYLYFLIFVAIFMIYSVIHQMIFPLDLRLYIIWVFIFCIISTAYGYTAYGVLVGYCAYFLGIQINFFKTKPALKYTTAIVLYFLSVALIFRLESVQIISALFELFASSTAVILMHLVTKHLLKRINTDILAEMYKEDISSFFSQYNFSERDKKMLEEVLAGCKYEEIAINHNLSLSSVKKRLAFLYKILGVTCQIDFIIKFSGTDSTKV